MTMSEQRFAVTTLPAKHSGRSQTIGTPLTGMDFAFDGVQCSRCRVTAMQKGMTGLVILRLQLQDRG